MDTSPSAVVAIAALSRLGAVAVLLPPDDDLAAAVQLCEVADIVTDADHLATATATGVRALVLGHGRTADLCRTAGPGRRAGPPRRVRRAAAAVVSPTPGHASDLAFVFFSTTGGRRVVKKVTNHRWALSAYGTATAAALGRGDTIYCLTPLHHPSGLIGGLGGAIAGRSRVALTRGVDPTRFADEVHRYGVTVVTYTWALLRELVEATSPELAEHHPIRLFIGAGMPIGLWQKVTTGSPRPECSSSMPPPKGMRCWPMSPARRSGPRVGRCRAASRFGSAATTPRRAGSSWMTTGSCPLPDDEVGMLLAKPRSGLDAASVSMRSVFAEGDT